MRDLGPRAVLRLLVVALTLGLIINVIATNQGAPDLGSYTIVFLGSVSIGLAILAAYMRSRRSN